MTDRPEHPPERPTEHRVDEPDGGSVESREATRADADIDESAAGWPSPSGETGRGARPESFAEDEVTRASRAEDHALVRRAQAGDESAFEALVRRHQERAWRVARNLVASDEDARDLAQEAFLRVFRNLSSFDFEHGFTTWLYRIVTNLAIALLRKRRTAVSTTRSDPEEGDFELQDLKVERPSDGLEREELAREVRACLDSLAPHFQSVLTLREMEGLPCNEIAHIVGATHVTVRWRLHRGRKLFQEEWDRRRRLAQSDAGAIPPANAELSPHVESDEGFEP